jgi:hypothetical protein
LQRDVLVLGTRIHLKGLSYAVFIHEFQRAIMIAHAVIARRLCLKCQV